MVRVDLDVAKAGALPACEPDDVAARMGHERIRAGLILGKRRDKPAWKRRWKSSTPKG
jgi:hypothetical protein